MARRGVHFALTKSQAARLRAAAGDDERVMAIIERIEERWDKDHLMESDKAWDAMHRCLTDGHLTFEGGEYPLNLVVLGGEPLYGEDDYIVCLVRPREVKAAAAAMATLTKDWLRQRYFALVPPDYSRHYGEEDFAYTWSNFEDVRRFFTKAAADGRYVVFTVDP